MEEHQVVSAGEWLEARKALLAREKEFTRLRDELSRARRALPWVRVEKEYVFAGPHGSLTLADLFAGRRQLIVYHFMFGPDWEAGCKSCSFWADNYNGITVHLRQRDANLVVVSRAPVARLEAFRKRMGWSFPWVSSLGSDFNFDYQASFTAEAMAKGEVYYNYTRSEFPAEEAPGVSVFIKDDAGTIHHTYSCYARGLDMLNGAYHHLDLLPKGRDEENLPYHMDWVKLHDLYES
ncbi:MAG TPA: thioredoxin family protein [Candidatus Sulfotelmatobacter sp.]|nr:thioredoxin family protein [Candidatus Sulfotelmatobacter sp.]